MHYNGANSYLFVNGTKIYKFNARFWNFSVSDMSWKHFKRLAVDNMKKTGFTGYVYDFSVDDDPTAVDDIKDIQNIW